MDRVAFTPKTYNIFEFGFMNDFTTMLLAKEEYNIGISKLKYQDEDDFYCFSQNKAYTSENLYQKFNIYLVA